MEVFKVFATMSLVDIVSSPLKRIKDAVVKLDKDAMGLSAKMGRLAVSMAPVAAVAGLVLFGLTSCTTAAIAFEDAMADVGKVVNFETKAEMQEMSDIILEMSGRIPMAADGIAAIIASAAQSGVAKDDLAGFAEQAAKMGVAFDLTGDVAGKMMADWRAGMNLALPQVYALADAVNHLSNNMNATAPALGEVIQRVGPLAMTAGLAETEVAALGAAFLSAGASPEIASTALRKFTSTLVKGTALSKRATTAFAELGFSAEQMAKDMQVDAQGTIFSVLQALSEKPKELQVSLLTEMFGEEALGAIAPLLSNMGNLTQAFELIGNSSLYAGSMEEEFRVRSETTSNAIQLLRSKITSLMITVGTFFTPVISGAATAIGWIADGLRAVASTAVGEFLIKLLAGLSAGIIALTLFGGAILLIKIMLPVVLAALGTSFAALAAIALPLLAVAAVIGGLYLAFKYNFGGITDIVMGWYNKISLVVKGVMAVFETLDGGIGELRGQLAEDIESNGLLGAVTQIAKVLYRFKQLFTGYWDAIVGSLKKAAGTFENSFGRLFSSFGRLAQNFGKILSVASPLIPLFEKLFGLSSDTSASNWEKFGNVLGSVVGFALEALAVALASVVSTISVVIDGLSGFISLITGDFAGAEEAINSIQETVRGLFTSFFDLFGMGDTFNAFINGLVSAAEKIKSGFADVWNRFTTWLSSLDLSERGKALLGTFVDGIKASAGQLIDSAVSIFSELREYLPFSDAHKGPLSSLTTSGMALVGTLGEGVAAGEYGLIAPMQNVLGALSSRILSQMPDIPLLKTGVQLATNFIQDPKLPDLPAALTKNENGRNNGSSDQKSVSISISKLVLPNVEEPKDFIAELQGLVAEYQGA